MIPKTWYILVSECSFGVNSCEIDTRPQTAATFSSDSHPTSYICLHYRSTSLPYTSLPLLCACPSLVLMHNPFLCCCLLQIGEVGTLLVFVISRSESFALFTGWGDSSAAVFKIRWEGETKAVWVHWCVLPLCVIWESLPECLSFSSLCFPENNLFSSDSFVFISIFSTFFLFPQIHFVHCIFSVSHLCLKKLQHSVGTKLLWYFKAFHGLFSYLCGA